MLTEIDIKKFASYNWGLKDGRKQAREEGIYEERKRVAIQLLPMMDDSAIVKVTGLALEDVIKLREAE